MNLNETSSSLKFDSKIQSAGYSVSLFADALFKSVRTIVVSKVKGIPYYNPTKSNNNKPMKYEIKRVPSCANRFVTDLVLGRACLSNVKVVFWHVSERFNLHASVLGYKLVT